MPAVLSVVDLLLGAALVVFFAVVMTATMFALAGLMLALAWLFRKVEL